MMPIKHLIKSQVNSNQSIIQSIVVWAGSERDPEGMDTLRLFSKDAVLETDLPQHGGVNIQVRVIEIFSIILVHTY